MRMILDDLVPERQAGRVRDVLHLVGVLLVVAAVLGVLFFLYVLINSAIVNPV